MLVTCLPVNVVISWPRHVASSISGTWLLDTSGHVIASLGPIEQVKPTEIGARALLNIIIKNKYI